MDKLRKEEIIPMEEVSLLPGDLKSIMRTRLRNLLLPYLGCVGVLAYIEFTGPGGLGSGRAGLVGDAGGDNMFYEVAPWLPGFMFVLGTIYFVNYYLQAIHPLRRDIKKGTKLILSLKLEKRDPFFNRYFIYVPLQKSRQLELSGEDYFKLTDGAVKLVVGSSSLIILQLLNGDDNISFHQHKKY